MKGLGLLTHALSICVVSTVLSSCGAYSAMVPEGNRADASAHFLSQMPAIAPSLPGSTDVENVLYRFKGAPDGAGPAGDLVADADGALYGTTNAGGAHGSGTVFKLSPSASGYTESVIWDFDCDPGCEPDSSLVIDKHGALYGTTTWAGTSRGTIFKLMPTPSASGYAERVVYSFCAKPLCADGSGPDGGVVIGPDGDLYGTTEFGGSSRRCNLGGEQIGCGTVFKLMPSGKGYRVLHAFRRNPDGAFPHAGVTFDRSGALFGTTAEGGDGGKSNVDGGTVFKLTPSGSGYSESVLHDFINGRDGAYPTSPVIVSQNGTLYGTTLLGGGHGGGVAFELTPSAYHEHVLHTFKGGPDGASPAAGLTFGNQGGLYGTTGFGGDKKCDYSWPGCGVVFELSP